MYKKKPSLAVCFTGFGLAAALAGCSQRTLSSAGQDARHDAAAVDKQAHLAANQVKPQADQLALQTRVTAALAAAKLSPAVHVRADAGGVYLRGTVATDADKARAGQIARDTLGPNKAVHNQLQVSGG